MTEPLQTLDNLPPEFDSRKLDLLNRHQVFVETKHITGIIFDTRLVG